MKTLTNVSSWTQINSVLKVDVGSNVEEGKCTIIVPFQSLSEEFDELFKNHVISQLGEENLFKQQENENEQ